MGGVAHPVVIGYQGGSAQDEVGNGGLAAGVAVTVKGGEKHGQHAGEIGFAAEEDPLPGDEDIVKKGGRVGNSVEMVGMDMLSRARGGNADHLLDPRGIRRNGEGDGPIGIFVGHQAGGHNDDLVGKGRVGIVRLAAPHNDAVLFLFDDPQVKVGVALLERSLGAVPLDIGLGTVAHQVVFLKIFHEFNKTGVILCPKSIITVFAHH